MHAGWRERRDGWPLNADGAGCNTDLNIKRVSRSAAIAPPRFLILSCSGFLYLLRPCCNLGLERGFILKDVSLLGPQSMSKLSIKRFLSWKSKSDFTSSGVARSTVATLKFLYNKLQLWTPLNLFRLKCKNNFGSLMVWLRCTHLLCTWGKAFPFTF